jgi:predicted GH43/DUF377 family glycosyl hydrolase
MIEHLHRVAAHAYHCGEMDVGRRCCERLLRLPLAHDREQRVRANRTWYTQTLEEMGVSVRFQRIDIPHRDGWSLFNPSIVHHEGRTLVNVRSSNYRIDENGRYVMPPEDGETIKTENILWWPHEEGHVVRPWTADYPTSDVPVEGLEDVRLNSVGGQLMVSATCRNWEGHDGTCRIATGTMELVDRIDGLRCHETISGRHEKNWMPITGRREFLYACYHEGHTCTVVDDGTDWTVTARAKAPPVARGFRGGSQLVPGAAGKWLAIIHEVAHDNCRVYEHRFVEFDEEADWRITRVSPPFAFRETRNIEFCAGLINRCGILTASYGHRDREAWLADTPLDDVLSTMEDAWA